VEAADQGSRGNAVAAVVALVALALVVGITQLVADDAAGTPATTPVAAVDVAEEVPYPAVTAAPVGHHGEYDVQYDDLPPETQDQLDIAREIIERYPTAADAMADGWTPATINLRGIAAHFLRGGVVTFGTAIDDTFDVTQPEALLFDGIEPDAPIIGVSYLVSSPTDPEGFHGPWDVWHRHEAVCFAGGLVIAEIGGHHDSLIDTSEEDCRAQGGLIFPIENLTMIHVWMKPDWPSTHGVFSHDHPDLV
jgi:hypothetical protein